MSKRVFNKKGFTLIEIIISLLLIGIVAALVGMSGVYLINSYFFASVNTETMQKGQIAITRIQKELNNVKTVYDDPALTNGTKITFTSYRDAGATDHTICLGAGTTCGASGTNLLLDSVILTDKVSTFKLDYYNDYTGSGTQPVWSETSTKIIEVNLEITGYENTKAAFSARVAPSFM